MTHRRSINRAAGILLSVAVAAGTIISLIPGRALMADGSVKINKTNFPDEGFRQYLHDECDDDGDYVLSEEEQQTHNILFIGTEYDIASLEGINLLHELKGIDICNQERLTSLDLSGLTNLKDITIYHDDDHEGNLSSIDLTGCVSPEYISIEFQKLTSLDISDCSDLNYLGLYGNSTLTSIDVSNNPKIDYLDLDETSVSSLDVSNLKDLKNLYICDTGISSLDLSNNTKLELLHASGTKLSYLNISALKNLKSLAIDNTSIKTIDISNQQTLIDLYNGVFDSNTTHEDGVTSLVYDFLINEEDWDYYSLRYSDGTTIITEGAESGIEGFVERLYTVALGRQSDPAGKADWINRVRVGGNTGADLARGFLFSDEFLSKNMSNSDFVDVLYATFFDRPADEHKADWLGLMDSGWTKTQVIDGFINSTEWANLCLTFGIASGSTFKPNLTVTPSQDVIDFATRLYTTCLGRNADQGGLDNWANQLANMQISGSDAAHGFFFSAEFINAGHDNEEYVTRLYRTFMGREPDPAGFADWVGQLNNGADRESVFQGFAGSAEWAGICSDYGILR